MRGVPSQIHGFDVRAIDYRLVSGDGAADLEGEAPDRRLTGGLEASTSTGSGVDVGARVWGALFALLAALEYLRRRS